MRRTLSVSGIARDGLGVGIGFERGSSPISNSINKALQAQLDNKKKFEDDRYTPLPLESEVNC